jgi:hypothetical protein
VGAGKPDVDARRRSHTWLSPGTGGTLLLLSFPNCAVVVPCSFFLLDSEGRESGRGSASTVAPIVVSREGGARRCCCLSLPSLYGCEDVGGGTGEGDGDQAGGGSDRRSLFFGRWGQGSLTRKSVNGRTHCCLLQRAAHYCRCLSPPSSYGCDVAVGGKGEGDGDRAGGGSDQRRRWSRSLFLLDGECGDA